MSKEQEAGQPPVYDPQGQPPPPGYAPQQGYPAQSGYAPQQGYPAAPGQYGAYAPPGQVVIVANQPLTGPLPDDHCTFSIINTICCCFWIGIFAILKSQSVRDAIARGDRATAERSSAEALKLNKIALGVGIAVNVIYIAAVVVYVCFIVGAFY